MIERYWSITVALFPFLWKGFVETLYISLVAILVGSTIGFLIGVVRSQRVPVLSGVFGLYIHALRGTPFLVQLYLFYFVLPHSGVSWLSWNSITAAFVALSVYTSSYVAEIVKAAIEAVPRGQSEAATALGMTRLERLWHVVLPQALKLTVPPMSGVYVMIIKSTAILSVIGISELTRQGEISILRFPRDVLFIYGLIAAMYFVYCYPVLRFARWAERRLGGAAHRRSGLTHARRPARIDLVGAPTPLEPMSRIGTYAGHPQLFVKRDDCMPLAFGGNKVRSLEFWLGEALARESDVLVIAGGLASNQCRLAAAAAAKIGLDIVVLYAGDASLPLRGNALLTERMGAEIRRLGPVGEEERGLLADQTVAELKRAGRRPYLVGDPLSAPWDTSAPWRNWPGRQLRSAWLSGTSCFRDRWA